MMRTVSLILVIALSACVSPSKHSNPELPTLWPNHTDLHAKAIMQAAHQAAGGERWRRPKSLTMQGYGVFYRDGEAAHHEIHNMWRVYAREKSDAHKVDGKVRIESIKDGQAVINVAYDGATTYTPKGAQPKSAADQRWASNFGFGVIRHALDEGYSLERAADDLIDGRPAFMIRVIDPAGGQTLFGIAQDNYSVLKVAFDTPRGWHERIYSDFFSNDGENWVQPGRVRLYYGGVKANEVIWESYRINDDLPDCLFVLPETETCR